MPADLHTLLRSLLHPTAIDATRETDPTLLLAAALSTSQPADLLAAATRHAVTTRDRQLVAITAAHLRAEDDLVDALVRDHLADHPDSVLAAWIAAIPADPTSRRTT